MSKKIKSLLKRHVSVTRAAQLYQVSVATVWRWLQRGVRGRRLKSFLLGGRRRIYVHELRRFAETGETNTVEASVVDDRRRRTQQQLDQLLKRRAK